MDVLDKKRITLLSLMDMAEGDLDARYDRARVAVKRLTKDGWFGGEGNLTGPSESSEKKDSPSSSGRPATKRQVQRVIDLDDTYDVEALEAMSFDEVKELIQTLKG